MIMRKTCRVCFASFDTYERRRMKSIKCEHQVCRVCFFSLKEKSSIIVCPLCNIEGKYTEVPQSAWYEHRAFEKVLQRYERDLQYMQSYFKTIHFVEQFEPNGERIVRVEQPFFKDKSQCYETVLKNLIEDAQQEATYSKARDTEQLGTMIKNQEKPYQSLVKIRRGAPEKSPGFSKSCSKRMKGHERAWNCGSRR